MKKFWHCIVAAAVAILGLGIVATKTAPQNTRPLGDKPIPQSAVVVRDEAMEELEKANRLNKQPKKH